MVRVVIYSLLVIFLAGGFYILQVETEKQKALIKQHEADLRESQGKLDTLQQGGLKADFKQVFTDSCVQQSSKGGELKEAGIDVSAFCSCMADAHLKLDLSIQEETARRREFFSKGKPCFTDYMKEPIISTCEKMAALRDVNIDCMCFYAHSVKEQVTTWIMATEGTLDTMPEEKIYNMQVKNAQDVLKNCMKQ